ncbi:MAG: hypothetical protein J5872_02040 [Lachnospiraceae bacterium]|nr:hypothetical protein [Lachnospiraceae bacterium]
MSRIRKDYDTSFRARFRRYIMGETELPEVDYMPEFQKQIAEEKAEDERATEHYLMPPVVDPMEDAKRYAEFSGMRWFRRLYAVMALVLCVGICGILIYNVAFMPEFGSADTAMNNEVTERYIEKGQEETGVVNTVTGVILQYRGFDTFGETHVLFLATIAVMILLKKRKDEEPVRMDGENPGGDRILRTMAQFMVPIIFLFGLYVLVNGHLSPGGGFSGGAIIGAGLILYSASFGFTATARFFNERIYDIVKVGSLVIYSLLIIYYLFTGANGIASVVPLGKAGTILSSGLILPINILVGFEVACTMYAFFALFRKGGL